MSSVIGVGRVGMGALGGPGGGMASSPPGEWARAASPCGSPPPPGGWARAASSCGAWRQQVQFTCQAGDAGGHNSAVTLVVTIWAQLEPRKSAGLHVKLNQRYGSEIGLSIGSVVADRELQIN